MDDKTQELIRRQTKAITIMFVSILILLVIICLLLYYQANNTGNKAVEKENTFFCGTDLLAKNKSENKANKFGIKGEFEHGRKLFKQNCAVCHSISDQTLTGPGLAGVFDRVPQPSTEWLKKYILNNEKVKQNGDAYSLMLKDKYKESGRMTLFDSVLSEKDLTDLMYYLVGN